jgi:nucleoside-diphosphate-sugar epimerase
MATKETVLITGGSGFIGSYCIVKALEQGYNVRTTLRSLKRSDEVRQALRKGGATEDQANSMTFVELDLTKDDGWTAAATGCTYVLHVASPFPAGAPKHEDDLIIPAREGTLRALRAAKAAGTVKRVVVTSSFAAIGYGEVPAGKPFDEENWSNLENPAKPVSPYAKSKTLAERAAWEYIKTEGGDLELAVVNPVGVFGPVLSPDFATSVELVSRLIKGQVPGCPQLTLGVVDVRDIATLHLLAMSHPDAAGQRFLGTADGDFLSVLQISNFLQDSDLPAHIKKKLPTRELPNFLLKIAGLFDKTIGMVTPELGKPKNGTNAKAKRVLGWTPRSAQEAVVSSAKSLIEVGVAK